ncbi:MAG: hypothetical protein HC805_06375 [Alkalinema sp. RL_2_19]|nr:hypothetical protein [Alkalinema sp. RL_2_19]
MILAMKFDQNSPMPPLSLEEVREKLLAWDALPAKSNHCYDPSQVIAEAVDRIQQFLDEGYTWPEITALLQESFSISLAPNTVRNYWYRERKRKTNPKRRWSRRRASASSAAQQTGLPQANAPAPRTSVNVRDAELNETLPPPAKPVFKENPPPATPSQIATPAVAASTLEAFSDESDWTDEELEAALVIPDRLDEAGVVRFRAALRILKERDIPRWQHLYSAAMRAGVNVPGGNFPDLRQQYKLFNQY